MTDRLFHCARFASQGVRYPLPLTGPVEWQPGGAPVRVPLPDVPADHIIAASFAAPDCAAPFSFRLADRTGCFETARFGAAVRRRESADGEGVAVPVDYFHAERPLQNPVLTLRCEAPRPPVCLLVVSVRPRETAPPRHSIRDTPVAVASSLSQTVLSERLRAHACGPTSVAMALGIDARPDFDAFVAEARHPPTGLCGVWPQNIWAAAGRGALGAVELVHDWRPVLAVLARGWPVVASIRFPDGGLAGSPLEATGGHLVLLRGARGGALVVNDPAAPPDSVVRRYETPAFAEAWMRHRGAAYVIAPSPLWRDTG